MDEPTYELPRNAPAPSPLESPQRTAWQRFMKALGPVGVVLVVIAKFLGNLKFLWFPIVKFGLPVLKTGGTMLISIWFYAQTWGWKFAVGFVVLILIHECGHLAAAKRFGLKVSAPMFIPFMGAFIALKDAPKNAWMEACVGIEGPIWGALGAGACEVVFLITGEPLWRALAYSGFFLNLFNLAPVGFLDGGRVMTAISPWLWVAGLGLLVAALGAGVLKMNFLLIMILVMGLPRLWSLFRAKTDEEKRYFEVTPAQRWEMSGKYFGLLAALVYAMHVTHVAPPGH